MRLTYRLNQPKASVYLYLKRLSFIGQGLLLLMVVGLAVTLQSGTILAVQTGSMVPVFAPGDAVIIREYPQQLRLGQVITYRSHQDPRQFVSHRIIAIDTHDQKLITKGDNLSQPDPPIRNWDVIGNVICVIPRAGYILNFLLAWPGLISAIYVPAVAILILEVRRLCLRQYGQFTVPIATKNSIYHSALKHKGLY